MADAGATRERILRAAYRCVERDGLEAATLETVSREAGVARATLYRHFPGGRDELFEAVVSWEVGQFFAALAREVEGASDFPDWFERMLWAARERLDRHRVLQDVLQQDAGEVVPRLATVLPIVLGLLRQEMAVRLGMLSPERLKPGVDLGEASDVLSRLMLSFIGTPGCWRMEEPAELRRLVRRHLLAGVVEP